MAKKTEKVESTGNNKVQAALALLNKTFGEGSAMTFNSTEVKKIPAISTGSISLDLALGIGGLPLGRCCEIFGPESSGKSTICLQVCAEAQKQGYTVAYFDLENAFDPLYAKNLGVDLNNLIFSQPSSMEDAFNAMKVLLENKLCNVIIFDSIASGRTKAELAENFEVGDNLIGLQARLMSQGLRSIAPLANEANCLCLFTNQIRQKIGVMFGCFHYNTQIVLADGTSEKIGKIVNNKLPVEVLSYNKNTGKVEPKKVINWFDNGKFENLYKVICAKPYDNGLCKVVVADDHIFITKCGERKLSELKPGDSIYIKDNELEGKEFEAFVVGSILGDGSIKKARNNLHSKLLFKHSFEQNSYCKWKRSLIPSKLISCEYVDGHGRYGFDLKYSLHYTKYLSCKKKSRVYKCKLTDEFIKNIDLLSLAIWYLDDGTFTGSHEKYGNGKSYISARHLDDDDINKICNHIEKLGVPKPTICSNKILLWSGENCKKFQLAIAKYVPTCMRKKINEKISTDGDNLKEFVVTDYDTLVETPILTIEKVVYNNRATHKYDLQIEDNSNYFADNILVHNSPEVTSGGNAMAFYSSVRMRISGKTQIKEGKGDDAIATARETEVKIVKNKVAPPFRTANFVIRFGKGISKEEEVLDYAIKFGLIEKAGAWFKYKGENVAQGKEKALVWLKSNPELLDEFTTKVKEFVMSSFENTEEDEDLALQDNEDNIKYNPETGEILEEGDK